jgi:hypothetical protein
LGKYVLLMKVFIYAFILTLAMSGFTTTDGTVAIFMATSGSS